VYPPSPSSDLNHEVTTSQYLFKIFMLILLQVDRLSCRYTTYPNIPEINLEDEPQKAKISKAMRAYLERARRHGECIRVLYALVLYNKVENCIL
jgi:hypothetical protein